MKISASKLYDLPSLNEWIDSHYWAEIKGASILIGSSQDDIDNAYNFWKYKLVRSDINTIKFKTWLQKEFPKNKINIKNFKMMYFPITNSQYDFFLRKLIPNSPIPESIRLKEGSVNPVWGITFKQANLYAKTLEKYLSTKNRCHLIKVSVPSEYEWEYAARGNSNNEYPYGNYFDCKKSNTIESGIFTTTPVDTYYKSRSQMGIFDMAGNVEEWTSSIYKPYPGGEYIEDDLSKKNKKYNILKGGCFRLGGDLTRCARRHGLNLSRAPIVGFRLICRNEIY
tara:strand:- start:371 stop:1216 length:846 start_codon:yes stop_codon:yes gene_type:complete